MIKKDKILLTGAGGQLGQVMTDALSERYDTDQIIVTDIRSFDTPYSFYSVDVMDEKALETIVSKEKVTQIYHLAAILSAKGEENPLFTNEVNIKGLLNVLEVSRKNGVDKVFCPSSIAVFGQGINRELAAQDDVLIPKTVYGITKVAGELWTNYYWDRYQLDVRSIRYPGVIGYQTLPGGGTTDYAVDIYHAAVEGRTFECFLESDAKLPMIYMEDAIRGTMELMEAPANDISLRTSYNLQGFSFTPEEVYASIKKYMPNFEIKYKPDHRQKIAENWPQAIDDSQARSDWGWKPAYNLDQMSIDMLDNLKKQKS